MTATLDHLLFERVAAPPDLGGAPLFVAVLLARWAILLGPAALVALWSSGGERRRSAVAAGLAGTLALAAAALLSVVVVEPRPFMDGHARNFLDHARDSGFPSDHATVLFALGFAFWLRPPPRLPHLWAAAMALAIAVGGARVFLGAHYPVDIAGAAVVAALAAMVATTSWGRVATAKITGGLEWCSRRVVSALRRRHK